MSVRGRRRTRQVAVPRPGDGVVLVVGGSHGIGAILVEEFVALGCRVVAAARWSRDPMPADTDRLRHVRVDACDPGATAATVARLHEQGGPIRLAICTVGDIDVGSVLDSEVLEEMLYANVWPCVNLARAVVPAMLGSGGGRLVVIGSGWAKMPTAGAGGYAAAKSALASLADALNVEYAAAGVAVHVLFPGYVAETRLAAKARRLGLREPFPLLHTRRRSLRRVAARLARSDPPHWLYVNPLEHYAGAAASVWQGGFLSVIDRLQPFPAFVARSRRGVAG